MSGPGVEIHLDIESAIEEMTAGLAKGSKAADKAIGRAIRKTMRWLAGKTLQMLARETGIDRKALKGRVIERTDTVLRRGQVWIGLDPVDAHRAGKPRQTAAGVTVKRHEFQSAFLATVNGSAKVFRRVHRGPGSSRKGRKGGRLPIEKMQIPISETGKRVAASLQQQAEQRFRVLLEQELNYAVLHEQ